MTPNDLIDDLRGRINPAYARQLGTESYERRLCVEALESQASEIERLRLALMNIGERARRKAGNSLDNPTDFAIAQDRGMALAEISDSVTKVLVPNATGKQTDDSCAVVRSA